MNCVQIAQIYSDLSKRTRHPWVTLTPHMTWELVQVELGVDPHIMTGPYAHVNTQLFLLSVYLHRQEH